MGETISLSVLSQSAPADQVVKQIETPRSPDPIMRRPCADREEKRVTRGSDTAGSRKHRSGDACLTDPNQRRHLGIEVSRLARSCRDWHQLLEPSIASGNSKI